MALKKDTGRTHQSAPAENPELGEASAEASAKAGLSAYALAKEDYKKTPLGWLPREWEVVRLKRIIKKLDSGNSVNCTEDYKGNPEVGVLKTSAVTSGKFLPSEMKVPLESEVSKLQVNVEKDRLIICRKNTPDLVGSCVLTSETYSNIFLPDLLWQTVPNLDRKHHIKYIYLALNENKCKWRIKTLANGSSRSMVNISKESFLEILIPLPPLPEQQQIAAILSAWDKVIERTQALIAAKEERRKGVMQRLLRGKVRLDEFIQSKGTFKTKFGDYPTDWKYPKIGEVAKQVSIKNSKGEDLPVLSCTKHQGLVDSLEYFGKQIYSKDTSTYKIVSRGQFAYATNHIEEGSIGYQSLYDKALISPMYTAFKTNSAVNDYFLFKLLKTPLYIHIYQASTSASVDRRGSLRWKEFSNIHIPLPPIEEQKAIAKILMEADRELELLHAKLEALRAQKKGLMQRLLTGRVRVKI